MSELLRRSDSPLGDWDPLRMVREAIRRDPFRDVLSWLPRGSEPDAWVPSFEVRETDTELRFLADVPGMRRDDLEVRVTGNRLAVSGLRHAEERTNHEQVHTWERSFGQFMRSFVLPEYIEPDHITSDLRDGVLTIVVPKKPAGATRKIAIGAPNTKA